jgi:hypothetical protein
VHLRLSRRAIRATDLALALWVALWIAIAILVHRDLRQLPQLSDAAIAAGDALMTTADALAVVAGIPFVPDSIPRLEDQVRAAAREAVVAGRASRDDLRAYSTATTFALVTGPTLPPLLVYLPLRTRWRRDRRAVAAALAAGRPDVRHYLARRALAAAGYETFSRHTDDGELRPGAVDELSEHELRRLGLAGRG